MTRRTDIKKILVLGAGPIRIGQACEFDYSGTQACKALSEEGYEVVLVNSNPATIMTDPDLAARTYVEPLTAAFVESVIEKERPDSLLPTMGGQTALNLAVELANSGVLKRYGVELIGARLDSILLAEDRELFRSKMLEIGVPVLKSAIVRNEDEIDRASQKLGLPIIVRPAFTLGGSGSGVANTREELLEACRKGLQSSPVREVLLEESAAGWKEIELEVVRDTHDNFIVVCSIENIDPMGVHTGDSITVAPLQTLSDKDFQKLRDAARRIIVAIGIECGGANIQFALHPTTGEFVTIEMNPRVSRSSALASKATGYPIAKVAAKLAVGLSLDELKNEIAGDISACFEPVVDYVVTKIPRFNFEKYRHASEALGTEMKSVGEAMSVGTTFQESVQKALRSLDLSQHGFAELPARRMSRIKGDSRAIALERMRTPSKYRLTDVWGAFAAGLSVEEIEAESRIDPWFLHNLQELFEIEMNFVALLEGASPKDKKALLALIDGDLLREMKVCGFSDRQLADITSRVSRNIKITEEDVFQLRKERSVFPAFRRIDTCAAEFPADTSYLYSTYASVEAETTSSNKTKVVVLGSGPNRVGQAIEFDYCCVQASLALREMGIESIMVNCNPETVSTDYDASDVLYFEPVTLEDATNVILQEKPMGVIVQFGGQTPLNLAKQLEDRGARILGTSCHSTDLAEDRDHFNRVLDRLELSYPAGQAVRSAEEALKVAGELGYPVLVRPSYVLSGANMQIVHDEDRLTELMHYIFEHSPDRSVLINKMLNNAIELDVDALSDGKGVVIAGIMEHIEEAGVHSGDSSCIIPAHSLSKRMIEEIERATEALAIELKIIGLLNIQMAVLDDVLYILEVNPRASRTVPFVSKATGVPWAKLATRIIMGESLAALSEEICRASNHVAIKTVVIPYNRFPSADVFLGPEMRSTGEVMGIAETRAEAMMKAQLGAGRNLKREGHVLISAATDLRDSALDAVLAYSALPYKVSITRELAEEIKAPASVNVVDLKSDSVWNIAEQLQELGVTTVVSLSPLYQLDSKENLLRRATISRRLHLTMTLKEALAIATAIGEMNGCEFTVLSLQEHYKRSESIPRPLRDDASIR